MRDDLRAPLRQAEDDGLALIVDAMENAGLAETYRRPDGSAAARLTERGEQVREALSEVADEGAEAQLD